MGDAVAFQGMKALVVKKGLGKGMAGGIAIQHRHQIGAHRRPDLGIGGDGFLESLARGQGPQGLAAQLAGHVIGERILKPVMLEDGGMDKARQGRLALSNLFGFRPQPVPDRIAAGQFFAFDRHGLSFSAPLLPQTSVEFQKRQIPPF